MVNHYHSSPGVIAATISASEILVHAGRDGANTYADETYSFEVANGNPVANWTLRSTSGSRPSANRYIGNAYDSLGRW